jgi:hypothetical protein
MRATFNSQKKPAANNKRFAARQADGITIGCCTAIYILTLTLGLSSCNNQSKEKKTDINLVDTIKTDSIDNKQTDINNIDKSQYDQSFIDGLKKINEDPKFVGNFVLVGNDTIYLPEDLPLDKKQLFKGLKNGSQFFLTLKRTNLTNLTYNFKQITSGNKVINSINGIAVLSPGIVLASEMDEDEITGEGYGSAEYWDNSDNYSFAIRVGEKDKNDKVRVKIKLHHMDKKSKNVNLDDSPIMRTE